MELSLCIDKWNLNHNTLAARMKMHFATFNNKLSPKHRTSFTTGERVRLINVLRMMEKDLHDTIVNNWIPDVEKEKICPSCGYENNEPINGEFKCGICKITWLAIHQPKAILL